MKRDGAHPECVMAIYDRPRDFPGHVVMRKWTLAGGMLTPEQNVTLFAVQGPNPRSAISAARAQCKRLGLTFLPRRQSDDPVMVESWRGRIAAPLAAE